MWGSNMHKLSTKLCDDTRQDVVTFYFLMQKGGRQEGPPGKGWCSWGSWGRLHKEVTVIVQVFKMGV